MKKSEIYIKMRNEGFTYREIAEQCGCSYQNVAQHCARSKDAQFQGFTKSRCIYSGLRNWLNENKVSLSELVRVMCGRNDYSNSRNKIRGQLNGSNPFRMADINKIIALTGLTYEELFLAESEE